MKKIIYGLTLAIISIIMPFTVSAGGSQSKDSSGTAPVQVQTNTQRETLFLLHRKYICGNR